MVNPKIIPIDGHLVWDGLVFLIIAFTILFIPVIIYNLFLEAKKKRELKVEAPPEMAGFEYLIPGAFALLTFFDLLFFRSTAGESVYLLCIAQDGKYLTPLFPFLTVLTLFLFILAYAFRRFYDIRCLKKGYMNRSLINILKYNEETLALIKRTINSQPR